MADIIHLNKVRKSRAKTAKRVQADANAAKFGRTKSLKLKEALENQKAKRDLDGRERLK